MKYKEGDKVRVITDIYSSPGEDINIERGSILSVVKKCPTKGYWIDNSTVEEFSLNDYGSHRTHFELVEEKKVNNRFAVGDRVVSIKDTPSVPEGWIGYVTDKMSPDYEYVCHKVGYENQTELFREDELELLSVGTATKENKPDVINSPKHYAVFEQVEAIQVIASSMTQDQFYGYCLGNILKYRLRAGGKDDVMQELGKADRYQGLYTEHKHLCKEVK